MTGKAVANVNVNVKGRTIKQGILFWPLCESKQRQNGSVGGHLESNITTKLH